VRGKGQGDFNAGAGGNDPIEVEKDPARADVLGFSKELWNGFAGDPNGSGKAHVETSHGTPVWGFLQHQAFLRQ
jgi:hypothetical protein